MSALLELAERCEQATGLDRELDCLIHCAVNGWRVVYKGKNVFADMGEGMRRILVGWLDPGKEQRNFSMTSNSLAPTYTASLDAAMTLVPEGGSAGFRVSHHPELRRKSWAEIWTHEDAESDDGLFRSAAQTPALALCAAALRAKVAA